MILSMFGLLSLQHYKQFKGFFSCDDVESYTGALISLVLRID